MPCGHVCGLLCKEDCDPSNCRKMVEASILAKCGHIVKEVPCFMKTLHDKGKNFSIFRIVQNRGYSEFDKLLFVNCIQIIEIEMVV